MLKQKRILSCLLALILIFSMSLTALAEERPTTWDLTDLYADDAALEAELTAFEDKIAQISDYRGTLNTAEGVVAWYEFIDDMSMIFNRVSTYASMKTTLNAGDGDAWTLYGRVSNLGDTISAETAFANEELFSQSEEFLDSLEKDERMTPYLLEFTRTRSEIPHQLPEEQEKLLIPLDRVTNGAADLRSTLSNMELPWQSIVFPDGVARTADESNYGLALGGGFSQEFRLAYSTAMMEAYQAFRNTYAQNYNNYCTGTSELAKAHGYSSALEAALATEYTQPELYQAVIDASLTGDDLVERYASLMKRELGLESLYGFDMNLSIAPDPGKTYSYDEACELVLNALAPLGEAYVADARKALESGWVDVYSAEGKQSGAYSAGIISAHPYMLLNFDGTIRSVSTLAHELGHTMNQWYSAQTQSCFYLKNPGTLVSEVTSTLNELLLSDYLIKNAATDDERKYYIAQEMSTLYGTFFTQAQFARFQQISIEALESGETLTADLLDALWLENLALYSGNGAISETENSGIGWARIPHFFQGYYVYQYAVAISASCDIAQRITAGEEGAVESYLEYVSSGDPASTEDTLAIAGVDATNSDFVDNLLVRFGTLMDEYEAIEAK